MLTRIELKNFRGHVHTTVPLTRFTLLVGDNAVGKTSVLESVSLVSGAVADARRGAQDATDWSLMQRSGATDDTELALCGDDEAVWSFHLVVPAPRRSRDSWVYTASSGDKTTTGDRPGLSRAESDPMMPAHYWAQPPRLHRFDARRIAAPSHSDETVPTLGVDGYGLATVLKELKANDDRRFHDVVTAATTVVPSLRELKFRRVAETLEVPRIVQIDGQRVTVPEATRVVSDELLVRFADTDWLPARVASEGTLLTLAILALAHAQAAPRVVLLDDIDRGLHPRAQGELVSVLRHVLDNLPLLQCIATSHSPYIVDSFEPDAVVVLGRPGGGPVVARRLSEHPDERLRAALTTGEFLTASGPGWYWS